jgi:PncC family amidohydrolase
MASDISSELIRLLRLKGLTISGAESCTGGLVSKKITDIPGSSEVFTGSVIAYSNTVKTSILKVNGNTLEKYGAVSCECAVEMAGGALSLFGTNIAFSLTGIAGPGGGTPEKPAGTVFSAIVFDKITRTYKNNFSGGREDVREKASTALLNNLLELVLSE